MPLRLRPTRGCLSAEGACAAARARLSARYDESNIAPRHGYRQLLRGLGAKEHEKPTRRQAGFITASVIDPFGNVIGLMYNPHYLEIVGATKTSTRSHADARFR